MSAFMIETVMLHLRGIRLYVLSRIFCNRLCWVRKRKPSDPIINSIKHIVSQVGGHPVTFPVAAEIRHSVTLTTAQHFPVLHWMQLDLGCDWKGYWMPSHLTENVFNTVNNWITQFSFSYSAKSVAENSRKDGGSLASVTVAIIKAFRAWNIHFR